MHAMLFMYSQHVYIVDGVLSYVNFVPAQRCLFTTYIGENIVTPLIFPRVAL